MISTPGEIEAKAMHKYSAHLSVLCTTNEALRTTLWDLERELAIIQKCDSSEELDHIKTRLNQLISYLNVMEIGSFSILSKRAMDNAWQRLP